MKEEEYKILIFKINGECYAAEIMEIERILGYTKTTILPDSPRFVDGVINYEEGILPIISLAKKFNEKEQEKCKDTKIIVAKDGENRIGIIVDEVSEVNDIKEECIEEAPEIISGVSKRYIKGLIKMENKIIILLNLSSILSEDEKEFIM